MKNEFEIELPRKNGQIETIKSRKSILLIGANGTGKTRLGAWIELKSSQKDNVHRISAQKSLAMPDNTTPVSIELAKKDLLYGDANADDSNLLWHKEHRRWSSRNNKSAAISSLNDFQKLMVYLFSEHTEKSAEYLEESKKNTERVEPPVTKLDMVKSLWEKILPHRELIIGGLRIQTCVKEQRDNPYNSSEMSDGERVIFYLIGQCLAASENGIIIVDEPEIHLHKSVLAPLWGEIENLRDDCLFIYITHDVDFSVALPESKKIWLKSYDGDSWDWEHVPDIEGLPEPLLIEILGSRKPVVFVEGRDGSFDLSLYRSVLTDHLVIPSGSCTQVIQIVKALQVSKELHHLEIFGVIDRDRRNETEIKALSGYNIYTLDVAEVENLFCVPEIISLVSQHLFRNPDDDIKLVMDFIVKKIKSELDVQISLRVANEIKYQLNCFNDKAKGKSALNAALANLVSGIDIDSLYQESQNLFHQAVEKKDYKLILQLYNRKSLATQISKHLGLSSGELAGIVVRMANSNSGDSVKEALKPYFGAFSDKIASDDARIVAPDPSVNNQ